MCTLVTSWPGSSQMEMRFDSTIGESKQDENHGEPWRTYKVSPLMSCSRWKTATFCFHAISEYVQPQSQLRSQKNLMSEMNEALENYSRAFMLVSSRWRTE